MFDPRLAAFQRTAISALGDALGYYRGQFGYEAHTGRYFLRDEQRGFLCDSKPARTDA